MASLRSQIKGVKGWVKKGWGLTKGHRGKLATAAFFDLLSAIPWIGLIFSSIGYGSLWLWMKLDEEDLDPSLFSGDMKKLAWTTAELIGGALGLSIIPGITMWVFYVIAEAKTGASAAEAVDTSAGDQPGPQSRAKKPRTKTSAYMKDAA